MLTRRQLLGAAPLAFARAATPARPNILFLAIDDLNDWVGFLGGYPGVQTPNLDRLASQGVVFRNAHCAAPLCNPSRTAILTGRHPASSGVYENNQPYASAPLLKNAVTLNQHFKNNGYTVQGTGKIYHGTFGQFADRAGWHHFEVTADESRLPQPGLQGGPAARGNFDFGPTTTPDEAMLDHASVNFAVQELAKSRREPQFLACGIYRPHLPWYVPKKYFDMYPLQSISLPAVKEDDLADIPPIGQKMAAANGDHPRITAANGWKQAVQGYLASISFADAMVGRLLRALETSPSANNTAVVLWSDHGWHLGEKQHWRKFTLWERSTRNVLAIKAPGLTKPRQSSNRPVGLLDIYPTLTELCHCPPQTPLDGRSLLPVLRNPQARWDHPAITTYGYRNHSIRTGDLTHGWRYIRYHDGGEELYSHKLDPHEWHNLATDPKYAEKKQQLARLLPQTDAPPAPTAKPGPTDV
jgi:arylsulfatase A-like enzyme